MIGITDHNSTRQAPIIRDYGKTKGIFVLTGAEICSKEEVHALTFFETDEQLTIFQHYLDVHLPDIPNDPEKFGFQVVVDPEEQIIYEEPKLLISALNQSLEEIVSCHPSAYREKHCNPFQNPTLQIHNSFAAA